MKPGERLLNGKQVIFLDATPVIYFARIGKLDLVSRMAEFFIVEEVYRETASGDYPDALVVKSLVSEGALKMYRVEDRDTVEALLRYPGVHLGEVETIVAAKEKQGLAVIDDANARAVAKVHGVAVAPGTVYVLFRLLSCGLVTCEEADEMLSQLVRGGLFLDSRSLLRARERLKEYNFE